MPLPTSPSKERLLPDGRRGAAVHLPVQDDLVLLQLQDDLVDASDHAVDSLGQTLAGLGLLQRPLLAGFRQLLLYLLQILNVTDKSRELRGPAEDNVALLEEPIILYPKGPDMICKPGYSCGTSLYSWTSSFSSSSSSFSRVRSFFCSFSFVQASLSRSISSLVISSL